MTNTLQGTVSATASSGALDVAIDSSVSQLWLPEAACDIFQDAFGLIYDSISGLYLATNTTAHALLHQSDPRITITIAADATSDVTTNIVFPYKAFDLHAGIPYWNGTAPYFPIRRATDNTYTLGRVFLQEAYVVVDWERRNMSISQANYEGGQADLASILPTEQTSQVTSTKGQIAAVVLVAVSMIAVAIAAFLWFRRRKTTSNLHRHAHTTITSSVTKQQVAQELEANSSARSSELMSKPLHELSGEPKKLIFELPGEAIKMPQMESR
jgi:HAMP domain-containing protein